jgi:cell division control protein 6
MAGRDKERDVINAFISSFDGDDVPTTLYVSGSPGTGKTALVNSCLGALESSGVKIISINCMALKCVDALWERVLEELGGSKVAKTRGRGKDAVERALSTLKTKWLGSYDSDCICRLTLRIVFWSWMN